MKRYRVEVSSRAVRELERLEYGIRVRIVDAIDGLQREPRPPGVKKPVGINGYRIRVGSYRVLYTVDDKKRIVRIYLAGHRREVYRNIR